MFWAQGTCLQCISSRLDFKFLAVVSQSCHSGLQAGKAFAAAEVRARSVPASIRPREISGVEENMLEIPLVVTLCLGHSDPGLSTVGGDLSPSRLVLPLGVP